MINKPERIAAVTSSCASKVMTLNKDKSDFGAPGLTYILEKRIEKRMGRSISVEKYSRSMAWGHFMEMRVEKLLGFDWKHTGDITQVHKTIDGWAGSPDFVGENRIADLKSFEPKAFAQLTDIILEGDVQKLKKEFPDEYWQLVSNCCIFDVQFADLITYMPYHSELEEIREMADDYIEEDQWKYRFIFECNELELPFLPDEGYYKNLNVMSFEPSLEDRTLLEMNVKKALALINT